MSVRRSDDNILQIIRDMRAEIDRIKREDHAVRRNDIRLGNLVITAHPDPSGNTTPTHLKVTNLVTGNVTLIATP